MSKRISHSIKRTGSQWLVRIYVDGLPVLKAWFPALELAQAWVEQQESQLAMEVR